ncbi:MAG: cobalt-precorrin-5B (C(1))-methyltransferase CbiD [Dehalococcoidia bacterium]|nr:cobalt-precorrin-5B (C(1))-methyltransferase CbiD [Dehalococcoidia bacterium]
MRKGYTTGTCAQAAAKACMLMLTSGRTPEQVEVETASGVKLTLNIVGQSLSDGLARCGVIKDAGDDPDVTHGTEIYAEVRLSHGQGVEVKGGTGVGRVTRPGLPLPPGEWAINPVPRSMIVRDAGALLPPGTRAEVTIVVPDGERLAAKTFNPRLGIVGGISILGTTGIVEPRSVEAYKVSLSLEIKVARAGGHKRLSLCSGRIGEALSRGALGFPQEAIIIVGDHVGFALEECRRWGVEEVLLVGHIGKLAKVAAGLMNTHHQSGDARLETIAACAALCGATRRVVSQVMALDAAEAAVDILRRESLEATFDEVARRVVWRIGMLVGPSVRLGCLILNLKGEVLGKCLGKSFTLSGWGLETRAT